MHNLGRGMWRRVGDYERLYLPELIKQTQLQEYAAYLEYNEKLKRQAAIDQYRKQMIQQTQQKTQTNETVVQEQIQLEKQEQQEQIQLEETNDITEEIVAVEKEIAKVPTILPKRGGKKYGYK